MPNSSGSLNSDKLRQVIGDAFDENELRDLCLTLNLDYEDLPPGGKSDKARELVLRLERERRLEALAEAVLAARPHIPRHSLLVDTATAASPFKGLLAFQEEDADIFYGRDAITGELVQRLLAPAEGDRFLALVGASGSGKSSIVRAGVIPALRRHTTWPIHIITPGVHPLESIAISLMQDSESVTAVTTLIDDMQKEPRALHLAVRRLLANDENRLLLVVDQFEELFTQCRDEAERRAFVDNLVTAVQPESAGPLHLIITLRADFYSHCLQFDPLHQLLEQQQKIVPAMTVDELRAAIEQPAARAGLRFEEGLVDLLLRDLGVSGSQSPEPGALPLLSHALLETWQRREGDRLTLAGYTDAGGVHGAIAKTAESTYQKLPPAQQAIARNIFLRLTELGEGTQDTRRRADLDELLPRTAEAAEVEAVLKLLADARLVTTHEDAAEVAHEALIREWPTLRRWLDENREGLRLHRDLTEAAEAWDENGRDPSYLYRGARLEGAREWAQTPAADLNALEQAFLDASLARQRDELAEARAIAEREADAARKLRQRAVFLRGALVIAAVLAVIAMLLFSQSSRNAANANAQSTRAIASEAEALAEAQNASRAQATAEAARAEAEDAAATAQAAEERANAGATAAAESALAAATAEAQAQEEAAEAARQGQLALAQSLAALSAVVVEQNNDSELGALLAIEAANINQANAGTVDWLIDDALRPLLSQPYFNNTLIGHQSWVTSLAVSPDGKWLVSGSDDDTLRLWSLADPAAASVAWPGHDQRVLAVAVSADGEWVVSGSLDETIRLWPLTAVTEGESPTPQVISMTALSDRPDPRVRHLALSNDNLLAVVLDDGTLRLWPLADLLADEKTPPLQLVPLAAGSEALAFSPDGAWLATGHNDGAVQVWPAADVVSDTFTVTQKAVLPTAVDVVAFSPDGDWLAAGGRNGDVALWPLADWLADPATRPLTWTAHADSVRALTFAPDGSQLISGSEDKTVAVWELTAVDADVPPLSARLPGHEDSVRALVMTPDGDRFASASKDGTIRLWTTAAIAPPASLSGERGLVAVAYSPDGEWLASGGGEGAILLWPVNDGPESAVSLPVHDGEILSLAFSPDGEWLASGSDDKQVKVWATADLLATEPITQPVAAWSHEERVMSVAFSADGRWLASGGLDNRVVLWDVAAQAEAQVWETDDRVRAVAFSPDGDWLAAGSDDHLVTLWSTTDFAREPVQRFGNLSGIRALAFSPDGRWLVTGGQGSDPIIRLLELTTVLSGEPLRVHDFRGHENGVRALAFSDDGAWLASGSDDNTVHLWHTAHQGAEPVVLRGHEQVAEPVVLRGHENGVRGVAFAPGSYRLASASQDGTVRLWLPLDELAQVGCTAVRRNLTRAEWQRFLPGEIYRQTCPNLPEAPIPTIL